MDNLVGYFWSPNHYGVAIAIASDRVVLSGNESRRYVRPVNKWNFTTETGSDGGYYRGTEVFGLIPD